MVWVAAVKNKDHGGINPYSQLIQHKITKFIIFLHNLSDIRLVYEKPFTNIYKLVRIRLVSFWFVLISRNSIEILRNSSEFDGNRQNSIEFVQNSSEFVRIRRNSTEFIGILQNSSEFVRIRRNSKKLDRIRLVS